MKMNQDNKNKWYVVDDKGLVVKGGMKKNEALEFMKNFVAKEPKEKQEKNSLSRKEQIRINRAKKMGISDNEYQLKFG